VDNILRGGRSWCTIDVLDEGSVACIIGRVGAGSMAAVLPLFRLWSGVGIGIKGGVGAGVGTRMVGNE
jgi:hypothetical protein